MIVVRFYFVRAHGVLYSDGMSIFTLGNIDCTLVYVFNSESEPEMKKNEKWERKFFSLRARFWRDIFHLQSAVGRLIMKLSSRKMRHAMRVDSISLVSSLKTTPLQIQKARALCKLCFPAPRSKKQQSRSFKCTWAYNTIMWVIPRILKFPLPLVHVCRYAWWLIETRSVLIVFEWVALCARNIYGNFCITYSFAELNFKS